MMNFPHLGFTASLLFWSLSTYGSPYDVLSIFLDTPPANDLRLQINLSDRDGNPGFEFFDSVTLIRPSRLDAFAASDLNLNLPGPFFLDPNPDRLNASGIGISKAYQAPNYGPLWFAVTMVEKPYFNNSGQHTGPFRWADESDWPIRFTNSAGEDAMFDRFEVTPANLVPLPASILLLGPGLLVAAGVCQRRVADLQTATSKRANKDKRIRDTR